jgi:hypothetical protein
MRTLATIVIAGLVTVALASACTMAWSEILLPALLPALGD